MGSPSLYLSPFCVIQAAVFVSGDSSITHRGHTVKGSVGMWLESDLLGRDATTGWKETRISLNRARGALKEYSIDLCYAMSRRGNGYPRCEEERKERASERERERGVATVATGTFPIGAQMIHKHNS